MLSLIGNDSGHVWPQVFRKNGREIKYITNDSNEEWYLCPPGRPWDIKPRIKRPNNQFSPVQKSFSLEPVDSGRKTDRQLPKFAKTVMKGGVFYFKWILIFIIRFHTVRFLLLLPNMKFRKLSDKEQLEVPLFRTAGSSSLEPHFLDWKFHYLEQLEVQAFNFIFDSFLTFWHDKKVTSKRELFVPQQMVFLFGFLSD